MRRHESNGERTLALLGTGLVATGAFAALAVSIFKKKTSYHDGRARRHLRKPRRRTRKVANAIGPVGKWYGHGAAALVVAGALWRRGARAGAAGVLLSSGAAAAVAKLFDHALPHRAPPPGRHSPTTPSFPSGHSLEPAAVSLATSYILARERVAHPLLLAPLALAIPVSSGIGRLYLDRHWTSDVVAGWLGGAAIASFSAAVYEGLRED